MGSLVQSPEVADALVSGIQASVTPTGSGGGIGSFLSKLLPAANAELENYDKENKARLFALGQNDKMTGVMNEVGLLDRKNYKEGRTYQTVVNGQIVLSQKFQQEVQNADPETFDPDEQLAKARQFNIDSVNNIYDSDLPTDIKQQLYQAQIKENASYMTVVEDKVKQRTADNAATARVNSVAVLTKDLQTWGAESMQVGLEAWIEKRTLAARAADPSKSMEDIQTEVGLDLKSALTYTMGGLQTDGTPADMDRLALLHDASNRLVGMGLMDGAIQLQEKANSIGTAIHTNHIARREFETQNLLDDWLMHPENRTVESLRDRTNRLKLDESIPYVDRIRMIGKITSYYAKEEAKILNAEVELDPRGSSPSEYIAKGKDKGKWDDDVLGSFIRESPQNPAMGAIAAINFFANAPEYSKGGVSKASAVVFDVLTGHARLSDAEAANDPYKDIRKEQFTITAQLYNKLKSENMSKANDLLSGIPDEYVDAYQSAFETGKSLEDVRTMFKDPVSVEAKYTSIQKVLDDRAGLTKALDLGNETFGSYDGRGSNSLSDGAEQFFADNVIDMMGGQKAYYAGVSKISQPSTAVALFAKNGGILPSTKGYNGIVMDLGVAKQVQNFRITGSNTPLPTSYFTDAVDGQREIFAQRNKVNASNVLVKSDATGQLMHFEVLKSKSILNLTGKGEHEVIATGSVSLARLKKAAEDNYAKDAERQRSPQGQSDKFTNTKIGEAMVTDLGSGRAAPQKINAHYANAVGGNLGLATLWVNHMQQMEGFTSVGTGTKDANTGRPSYVYGHGMTEKTLRDMGMLQAVINAKGKPQAMMDVQGQVVQAYYKNFNQELAKVGVPVPSGAPYAGIWTPSLMLMLDGKWHAGTTGRTGKKKQIKGLADAMNANSYAEGRRIMQGLSTYNRSALGSKRNRFMEAALKSHYKARGVR